MVEVTGIRAKWGTPSHRRHFEGDGVRDSSNTVRVNRFKTPNYMKVIFN